MRRLAASFVVTTSIVGCRAARPVERSPASVTRGTDGVCRYEPAGSSGGNPPAIYDVDCPPELGGPPAGPRLKGRETWLRMAPWLQLEYGATACRMYGEGFCPAPPVDAPCEYPVELPHVACARVTSDAGAQMHVEGFTWKSTAGVCERVAPFECGPGCKVPKGEVVPCE
jgi:hypothetical protein